MYPKGYNMNDKSLSEYVKQMRKEHNLTQVELSEKSGVGLRFVRELEQGKQTLRLDKVNQVLSLFGTEVGVVPISKFNKLRDKHSYTTKTSWQDCLQKMKMAIPFNMIQPTLNPAMRNLSASHCQSRKSHIQV